MHATAQTPITRNFTHFKVRPRVWIGFAIWAAYVAVVFVIQIASGIPYDQWDRSGFNLFFGAGLSLVIATVLLAITISLLGWWTPVLFEQNHSRHRWPIFIPILMGLAAVINLVATDWSSFDGAFFSASLALLLVGFTEEIVNRGALLTALRTRLGEGWVWFITSAMFALMHLVNIVLGSPVSATVTQVSLAFLAGTTFYILRRTTGSLIWAIVLHAVWDFSVFAVGHGTPSAFAPIGGTLQIFAGVLALICVAFVIRGANERIESNLTTQRRP